MPDLFHLPVPISERIPFDKYIPACERFLNFPPLRASQFSAKMIHQSPRGREAHASKTHPESTVDISPLKLVEPTAVQIQQCTHALQRSSRQACAGILQRHGRVNHPVQKNEYGGRGWEAKNEAEPSTELLLPPPNIIQPQRHFHPHVPRNDG